jgi:DNA processing protein
MSLPDEQQLLAAVQLNLVPGVGPRIQQLLCDRFGSPAEVLKVPADQLQQVQGVGWKLAEAIP